MRKVLSITLSLALASGSALALEAATTGSQATQATVGVINSKVDTGLAALQARLDKMEACEAQRKFYAPNDAKKDANGCVGVGDYDLNMASGNNVNFANGRVYVTQGAASNYGGLFYGNDHGAYGAGSYAGLIGTATGNGYGVMGYAIANSGGVGGRFEGGNSGVRGYAPTYGVYGETPNGYGVYGVANGSGYGVRGSSGSSWGGVFTSPNYGVYGQGATYGVYSDGPLCVNGSCITKWSGDYTLAGAYYRGSMGRTNSSGRGMMVMAAGGTNPYCGGNSANHFDLSGYVNGSRITFASNASDDRSKAGAITFFVPNGSSYAVYSSPYACGSGYFYVSEAVI